jgi:hypothetical protein
MLRHQMRLHSGGYGKHPGRNESAQYCSVDKNCIREPLPVRNIPLFNHLQGQCSPFQAAESPHDSKQQGNSPAGKGRQSFPTTM